MLKKKKKLGHDWPIIFCDPVIFSSQKSSLSSFIRKESLITGLPSSSFKDFPLLLFFLGIPSRTFFFMSKVELSVSL